MLTYCDILNIKNIKFVMDKGFYSDQNISDMLISKKNLQLLFLLSQLLLHLK